MDAIRVGMIWITIRLTNVQNNLIKFWKKKLLVAMYVLCVCACSCCKERT